MTREEAIKWLESIEDKYIHGGDAGFDESRKEAIHMAIEALSNPTIYGYSLEDLVVFAECCREQGIRKEEMRDFCLNISEAFRITTEYFIKKQEEIIRGLIHGED